MKSFGAEVLGSAAIIHDFADVRMAGVVADSLGRLPTIRVNAFAVRVEHLRDGVLGEPVDLEIRVGFA